MEIPTPPKAYDFDAKVEKATGEILAELDRKRKLGNKYLGARVTTCNCYGGGYPMDVICKVGQAFADKGWFVYLVQGGAYTTWSWMEVMNYEHPEGFDRAPKPSYFERIK